MIKVVTACEYIPATKQPTQGHWGSFKLVRALKAEAFTQYANVPVNGKTRRLTMDNRDDALGWAGEMLAPELDRVLGENVQVALVPIPGSKCTTRDLVKASRGYVIAKTAAQCMFSRGARVRSLLWWDQEMKPAHKGGPRTAAELEPHYAVLDINVPEQIVLVDDVFTMGGHICAAVARLRDHGYNVADVAFAVARTCWPEEGSSRTPTDNAFSIDTEEIREARDVDWDVYLAWLNSSDDDGR